MPDEVIELPDHNHALDIYARFPTIATVNGPLTGPLKVQNTLTEASLKKADGETVVTVRDGADTVMGTLELYTVDIDQ